MANLTGPAQTFEGSTTDVHTSAKHNFGVRAWDTNGNEFVYAQGTASVTAGSWVVFDHAASASHLLGGEGGLGVVGPVGIAGTAVVAGEHGWFQIYGENTVAKSDTTATNKQLYIDGTAGRVDDADAAGSTVVGAKSLSADTSNVVSVFINYPFVGGAAID